MEVAHTKTLKKDPAQLFDPQALPRPEPGMIVINNTDPVFLVLVRLTDSSSALRKAVLQWGFARAVKNSLAF